MDDIPKEFQDLPPDLVPMAYAVSIGDKSPNRSKAKYLKSLLSLADWPDGFKLAVLKARNSLDVLAGKEPTPLEIHWEADRELYSEFFATRKSLIKKPPKEPKFFTGKIPKPPSVRPSKKTQLP